MDFEAAYGPAAGGNDDYIVVAALPSEFDDVQLDVVATLIVTPQQLRDGEQVDFGDLSAFRYGIMVPGSDGEGILIEGVRGYYLTTLRYGAHMSSEVLAGLEVIEQSFEEVGPPVIDDETGCTETELALVDTVSVPVGASVERTTVVEVDSGERHCDRAISSSSGVEADALAEISSQLVDDGWEVSPVRKARELGPSEVWRLTAMKDWDGLMVEAYVTGSTLDRIFVTASDG